MILVKIRNVFGILRTLAEVVIFLKKDSTQFGLQPRPTIIGICNTRPRKPSFAPNFIYCFYIYA
jgi:hypothetical protein